MQQHQNIKAEKEPFHFWLEQVWAQLLHMQNTESFKNFPTEGMWDPHVTVIVFYYQALWIFQSYVCWFLFHGLLCSITKTMIFLYYVLHEIMHFNVFL